MTFSRPASEKRQRLPIDDVLPDIVGVLKRAPNLVLRAPTGAGKTTRVAPALVEAGVLTGSILLLEPRRVAARAAARRMAMECSVALGGDDIGYHVRFDRKAGPRTRIVAMTYGIFVRRIQDDPFLDGVGAVVFDEIHERSLDADLSLAMARKTQLEARPELRLVAMSATLDAAPLAAFLGDASVVTSQGRSFPVAVRHAETPSERDLDRAVAAAVASALADTGGDVLVFLPGVGEIRRAAGSLASLADREGFKVMELYGDLPAEEQDAVLRRSERRKVVLATNVAESSITIDGITTVIDSGLARVMRFDASVGLDRLEMVRISRASADQRAGRAGRTAPGTCLRLWSAHEDRTLRASEEPEIARVDLSRAVLELRAWGEPSVADFGWLQPPQASAIASAESLLRDLGALDGNGLSKTGRALSRLPLPPRIGRLLLEAARLGCLARASIAAALLTERDPLRRSRDAAPMIATTAWESDLLERVLLLERFADSRSGSFPELHAGAARGVLRVARDLQRMVEESSERDDRTCRTKAGAEEAFLRSILAAFPDRVAARRDRTTDRAVMVGGRGVRLGSESVVQTAELFVCVDIDAGRRGERAEARIRQASAIDADWLPAGAVERAEVVSFDADKERVTAVTQTRYRDLVLSEKASLPAASDASRILADAAAAAPARALALDDPDIAQLLARLHCLSRWMPDLALPEFDQLVHADIARELAYGRRSFEEMRRAPLLATILNQLTHAQRQALDRHAPEHLEVPSGSHIRLQYEPERPPVLAARIQEMFGLRDTPRIAGGRIAVLVHLLAPNGRPQQVTEDLASFWRTTYVEVRKQLRARYPRHSWPEDPLTAPPQRRPARPSRR